MGLCLLFRRYPCVNCSSVSRTHKAPPARQATFRLLRSLFGESDLSAHFRRSLFVCERHILLETVRLKQHSHLQLSLPAWSIHCLLLDPAWLLFVESSLW